MIFFNREITKDEVEAALQNENDVPIFDHKEKCALLQKTFFDGTHLEKEAFDANFKEETERTFKQLKQSVLVDGEDDFLNREITKDEVEAALQKLEYDKAFSPDNVYTDLVKRSNKALLESITLLFQNSFETGQLPSLWKTANVKFIQKPGKDTYHLPGSYRPISLTSIIGKCLEKIINTRLYAFSEHTNLLDNEQEGFREKRGTSHALLRLTQDIQDGFKVGKTTAAVFIDMEKAFNSVWRQGLLVKLHAMGIQNKMWRWLENFLEDREVSCCIGNYRSESTSTSMGLPQGSVLSPLLFNLYLRDIFEGVQSQKVKFADDGTIWRTDASTVILENELQADLNAITAWTSKWRMKLNTRKTEYCLFSKNQDSPADVKIRIKGEEIVRENSRGVAIYVHEKIPVDKCDILNDMDFRESSWCELRVDKQEKILIGGIYKSPIVV